MNQQLRIKKKYERIPNWLLIVCVILMLPVALFTMLACLCFLFLVLITPIFLVWNIFNWIF